MSGEKCSEKVKKSLEGVGEISVDSKEGRVVVTTKHPWSDIQDRIEQTGRTAVLCGFGGIYKCKLITLFQTHSGYLIF